MNAWFIRAGFVLLFLALSGHAFAAGEKILTLDQAIEIALGRNPSIAISQHEVMASRARLTQATSAYFPQVSAKTGYTRFNKWFADPFTGKEFRRQDDDYDIGLTISQYLYDFGQTSSKVDQGRFSLSASEKGVSKIISDTIRDIKKNYFEVLKKQSLIKVSQESVKNQEEHLRQARAFFQAGIRPKIDVTKGEVEYANSRLKLIRAEYALQSSILIFENVLGGPPAERPYSLADVPGQDAAEVLNIDSLVQESYGRRAEIAGLKDQIKAAHALIKSSQAAHWPTITANAGGGWSNNEFPVQDYWQFGINVSLPLFTGYRTQGRIAEARAEINKLEARLRQIELQVFNEISTAYLGVNEAAETIKTSRLALKQAQENMDLADGRYRNGVGSALEYSDAELVLTQAKSNLIQVSYEYHQKVADLDYALGR